MFKNFENFFEITITKIFTKLIADKLGKKTQVPNIVNLLLENLRREFIQIRETKNYKEYFLPLHIGKDQIWSLSHGRDEEDLN